MARPTILITNDDGFDSLFLHALIEAFKPLANILIAVPASEQSWIGRAMSRRREIEVREHPIAGMPGWAIDGTPSDCVNIALGHLCGSRRPDAVCSGINIGYNTTLPLIYSSGTVAGALEGAQWGIPAVAVSQVVPDHIFETVAHARGRLPAAEAASLHHSAAHAAAFTVALAGARNDDLLVHNINYPMPMQADCEVVRTVPARLQLGSLYESHAPNRFRFRYSPGETLPHDLPTDREVLARGAISHSILNFSHLAQSLPSPHP